MNLNKATIIGRIGQPIELKISPSGFNYVNFSVATTKKWKDKGNQQHEKTTWHYCSAFNKQAVLISQYCNKGDLVYIQGEINIDDYESKDGIKMKSCKIMVEEIIFLQSRGEKTGQGTTLESKTTNSSSEQSQSNLNANLNDLNNSAFGGTDYSQNDIPF